MDKNRELCELLGIPPIQDYLGRTVYFDFTTDAGKIMLLREMQKRKGWYEFCRLVGVPEHKYRNGEISTYLVEARYILDTTGQLRDKCIDFLNRRKG